MSKTKGGICRVQYDPLFQAPSGGLVMYPPWIRRDYHSAPFSTSVNLEIGGLYPF